MLGQLGKDVMRRPRDRDSGPYHAVLRAQHREEMRLALMEAGPEWPHFQGVQGYIAACARAFDEEGWRGQRWVELTPAEFACLMKGMPEVARWKYDGDYRFMGCRLRVRTTSPAAAPKDSPGEAGRP